MTEAEDPRRKHLDGLREASVAGAADGVSGHVIDDVADKVADGVADDVADGVADGTADDTTDNVADRVTDRVTDRITDGAGRETVMPLIQEELHVERRQVDSATVRIRKIVEAREVEVDVPLLQQRVQIERVAVNRIVDAMEPSRQEAGMTIVPVYEEVLVKRWLLKEELHISLTAHKASGGTVKAVLRRETIDVVRTPIAPGGAPDPSETDLSPPGIPST